MNTRAMDAHPKIGIVIPVFNRIACTVACLRSLEALAYPRYEIVVVDDGSTDGTSEVLRTRYPSVVVVKGDGNLWWSGAMNLGIDQALSDGCEYVLFLNNDDEVDAAILLNLMECARDHPRAVIGCKVRDHSQPQKLIFAGGDCDWERRGLFRYGDGEIDAGQYDTRREIKWIPGAGTFAHKDVFGKIGLIDQRAFPHYRADIDFTLRAHQAGFKVIFEPKAVLYKKRDSDAKTSSAVGHIVRRLVVPLFSRRSQMNLRLQAIFLWRHCPRRFLFRRFFSTYYTYYRGFMKVSVIVQALRARR